MHTSNSAHMTNSTSDTAASFKSDSNHSSDQTTLNFLKELLEKQTAILKALEAKFDLRLEAEQKCEGVSEIVENHINTMTNGLDIPEGLPEPFTVREYVFYKYKKDLSFARCVSLGSFASSYFTGINLKLPKQNINRYRVYNYTDLPAWDAAYFAWFSRKLS